MNTGAVSRFAGGSPTSVIVRLVVVSFIVGMILVSFGYDPSTIFERIVHDAERLIEFGLADIHHLGRILLTGAMVVVPIWLILRLIDAGRGR